MCLLKLRSSWSWATGVSRGIYASADGKQLGVAKAGAWDAPKADDDILTLPGEWLGTGQRGRSFANGTSVLIASSFADWRVEGPRTTFWMATAHSSADTTPTKPQFWWRQALGLQAGYVYVSEHGFLCNLVECAVSFDQLNIVELALFEHVSRRFMLIEESYAEHLRTTCSVAAGGRGREVDEGSMFLGNRRSPGAVLVSPDLQAHISARVAERSAELKERRKGHGERQLASGSAPAAGGSPGQVGDQLGPGGGRRKNNPNGKPQPKVGGQG